MGIPARCASAAVMIACGVALPEAMAWSDADCVVDALHAIPKVNSPATLHDAFLAFGGCDDGGVSELFTEAVTRMLALQWASVSQLQSLAATDPRFKQFIFKHIDATTPLETLRRISFNAQRHCPDRSQAFCEELRQAAEGVLRGSVPGADQTEVECEDAAASPEGHYLVLSCERPRHSEAPREFRLKDLQTGQVTWVYPIGRAAEALWSPDGAALAITDYAGSNIADLFLVFPERPQQTVNLQGETARSLGLLPSVAQNDHVYFEAVAWKDPETLLFRIWGQGDHDPQGFDESFEYRLGGKVARTGSGPARGH